MKVAAKQTFGEETKLFGGPSLDAIYVFASRYGVNPAPAFVRIRRSTMKAQYVNANTNLAGSISWPSFTYVETMGGFRGGGCDEINPCRDRALADQPVRPGPACARAAGDAERAVERPRERLPGEPAAGDERDAARARSSRRGTSPARSRSRARS